MKAGVGKNFKIPQSPEQFIGDNGAEFAASLGDLKCWAEIPLLNYTPLHLLKDHSVVRFRGMIQDMQDPEIYLERYEVKRRDGTTRIQEGKYRDCLVVNDGEEVNFEADDTTQGERRTLFLVSIPGINKWAEEYEGLCNEQNVPNIEMASRADTEKIRKRPASEVDIEENMDVDPQLTVGSTTLTASDTKKRQCMQDDSNESSSSVATSTIGSSYLLNSPIPDRPGKACMVKIYSDFDSYTLNSIIDFVGFLSVDPSLDASAMDADSENANELRAQNPPPSLIPRLHAIAAHKLKHPNPLLDSRLSPLFSTTIPAEEMNTLAVQKDLRILLKLCLFDDELAADYMLSHLISTVYFRSDLECIGKFTLNICNLPKEMVSDYTNKLYEILELLLPTSHYLPMSLDIMNTAAFVPKKDYETNKLVSGLLQLAPHTHLVLDETQMQQGKLEANGVMSIQHLAGLIKSQQIKCNFQYYEIDYNVDIPVLVLSEGRSMLPNDFTLPLEADNKSMELITEAFKAAHCYLQPARLERFRRYLTMAKIAEFTLGPEDGEIVHTDFVEMRKQDKLCSADDLHSLLVLSRLLGIARGKQVFDKESWELAKEMETKRKRRVQNLPKSRHLLRN